MSKSKKLKKRKRRKLSKLLKEPKQLSIRIPLAPPNKFFKSKKDYNRSINKEIAKNSLGDG